jgi:diguanylate cyclase (GGDEF)-like protein/PAS domain S-box-containing protein
MKALKQEQVNLELELETLMGDTRIAQVHLREAQYGANENLFVLGVEDVTEQRDVTKKLILADKVVQASEEAVLITNAEKEIIRVNPAFTKLTGYTEKEVLGKNPNILQSDRNTRELYDSMWASINQTGSWQGEIWDKRKDGTTYPKWMTISTITKPKSKEVTHYFALFSDVTEKKLAENQIKYLAYHDDLTGMANKTLFETKLVRAVEEAETEFFQLAVLQVDIDNFKTINDSLGHYVGDALIQAVAVEIRSCLRTTDLVARIGGDEFIILLERTPSREHVEKIATKILKRFYQPIDVLNHKMHLSISMGVCVYPEDGENHEALIRNVDTAMNQAKSDGKNQIAFFTKEMSQSAIKRLRMEYELRHAVQHQEFTLVYQPQIDLHDNSICGVEALLRWEHEGNFISPIHFIPVAEECGLIKQIGDWVMHQACATAADWHRRGMNVKMAVNLSGHQFEFTYLTNLIESVLELYDLPASLLCLEITEGVLVGNTSESLRLITALKKIGCTLAIDDFGTGYSSLSYLKAFDVDFLKIDRSFVTGLPTDTDDIAICNAIVNLSQSLNLNTVAEGVETAEQVEYMREYGVDKVQGYHFAKPMSAAQVLDFYDAWALNSTTTS